MLVINTQYHLNVNRAKTKKEILTFKRTYMWGKILCPMEATCR